MSIEVIATPPKKRGRKRKIRDTEDPDDTGVATPVIVSNDDVKEPVSTGRKRGRPPKRGKRGRPGKTPVSEDSSTCQENEQPNSPTVATPGKNVL